LITSLVDMGYNILATEHTAEFIVNNKFKNVEMVHKVSEPDRKPNILDLLFDGKIKFIVNIPSTSTLERYVGMLYDEYQIRRKAVEMGVPVLTTVESAYSFVRTLEWLKRNTPTVASLKSYTRL
jgi:carbamoyl-phosphate synthase large subunit